VKERERERGREKCEGPSIRFLAFGFWEKFLWFCFWGRKKDFLI
jgi:hypothetical protein